jgi:hypothetical protein
MFSNNFTSDQIRVSARRELAGCDETLTAQLNSWISLVFEKWKLEHGDRNPRQVNRGLLSDLIGKPIPFEDACPWECAGLINPSRIGLALKLMSDKYASFQSIIVKVPLRKVLAVLIANDGDTATDEELFSAYDLLVELQKIDSQMIGAAETLKGVEPMIKASIKQSKSQSVRAQKDRRTDVTQSALEGFRDRYYFEAGKYRGWKTSACLEFGIDLKTLNKRIKEQPG